MRYVALLFFILSTAGGLRAQSLSASPFVLGQEATLSLQGAPAQASVYYLLSLSGIGSGSCLPATGLCLDLIDPVVVVEQGLSDLSGNSTLSAIIPPNFPLIELDFQILTLDFPGGTPNFALSNALAVQVQDLSAFDDSFDGPTLRPEWQLLHPSLATIVQAGGRLSIEPLVGGGQQFWFQDGEGIFVYRDISGDFDCWAPVRSEAPNGSGSPPPTSYRLGGLMVRDPSSAPGSRNSCHVVIGSGTPGIPVAAEDKNTVESQSDFLLHPIAGPDAEGELRINRSGSFFSFYYRPLGALNWQLLRSHDRPDLPHTVQIGMMSYSAPNSPQIVTHFDSIHFSN